MGTKAPSPVGAHRSGPSCLRGCIWVGRGLHNAGRDEPALEWLRPAAMGKSTPDALRAEALFYIGELLKEPLPITGGKATPHERPGLGVELDDEKMEQYRVK